MTDELLDLAVIGNGPAGLAAALHGAVRQKKVKVFGPQQNFSMEKARHVDNYLGLPGKTGPELLELFRQHAQKFDIAFDKQRVQTAYHMGESWGLLLTDQSIIQAKALVLATGVELAKTLPGEREFLGKGVSTCATCDAALYRNKIVVVLGFHEEAIDEVNFIAQLASKTYFINRLGRPVQVDEGIEVVEDRPLEIQGDDHARTLILANGQIEADGFFFIRNAVPADQLVPGIELDGSHIAVDDKMQTNLPGLFAAGDVVGRPYQINIAAGQGQMAGHSAVAYIDNL